MSDDIDYAKCRVDEQLYSYYENYQKNQSNNTVTIVEIPKLNMFLKKNNNNSCK